VSEHYTTGYSQGEMGFWDISPSEFKAEIQTILRLSVLAFAFAIHEACSLTIIQLNF